MPKTMRQVDLLVESKHSVPIRFGRIFSRLFRLRVH